MNEFFSHSIFVEVVGWLSTALFLISIVVKSRVQLHILGVLTSVSTGFYAYKHDATAIWIKWIIALGFHIYMWRKLSLADPKTEE